MGKTCMCDKDRDLQESVDESASQEHLHQSRRGHGAAATIVSPLTPYKLIDKAINSDYQIDHKTNNRNDG